MNTKNNLLLLLSLIVISATMTGCGVVNSLRAKDNLNEGVREFNKGKFEVAQAKFERALELSPDLTNARLFKARAINAQFESTLKKDLGMQTIEIYEELIRNNPNNHAIVDQSLAFITKVYEKLAENTPDETDQSVENLERVRNEYRQKQRDTLQRRADAAKSAGDIETEAAVYHALGASYWQESYYNHSERYSRYNREVTPEVAAKMKPLVAKGHEYIQKSISIKPDQPDVWIFERLLLHEDLKIENDPARKKEIEAKIKDVSENYEKYKKLHQQQAEQVSQAAATK